MGSTGSRYTIRVPFSVRSADGTWATGSPVPPTRERRQLPPVDRVSRPIRTALRSAAKTCPRRTSARSREGPAPSSRSWTVIRGALQRIPDPTGHDRCPALGRRLRGVDVHGGRRFREQGRHRPRDDAVVERVVVEAVPSSPTPHDGRPELVGGVLPVSATSCTAVGQYTYELAVRLAGRAADPAMERHRVAVPTIGQARQGAGHDAQRDRLPVRAGVRHGRLPADGGRHVLVDRGGSASGRAGA